MKRGAHKRRLVLAVLAACLGLVAVAASVPAIATRWQEPPDASVAPPTSLRDTGLYADWERKTVAADNLPFAPQYPLWTDGAAKRRWIRIPAGAAIDGSRPDAWEFPVGTRLWKEFSFGGRRVETRTIERTAAGWVYATYIWNADASDAVLAPASGAVARAEVAPGVHHAIPGELDCRACHDGPSPLLGFSALQLSPDRDPGAPHAETLPPGAIDLAGLVDRGLLRGFPERMIGRPPRIAAASPVERAALGYLHGNCGGCHRQGSALTGLDLSLAYPVETQAGEAPAIRTTFARRSRFALPGAQAGTPSVRVVPGRPELSVLLARMNSTSTFARMPPLGTRLVDRQAVDIIERWIREVHTDTEREKARHP